MVLLLGRGEHCPRERQHQREMIPFHQWCAVVFTPLVTVLPNDLHDVGSSALDRAYWPFLADADLEVQTTLDIREYTDTHHPATVPTRGARPRPRDRQGLRGVLVLGSAIALGPVGRPPRPQPPHPARL